MPLYRVTGNWIHSETRVVEAESKKSAEKAYANNQYEDVIDWNLTDFIDVESIEALSRAEIMELGKRDRRV
jgi:hypothetical protein